jgi:hypothetical protein
VAEVDRYCRNCGHELNEDDRFCAGLQKTRARNGPCAYTGRRRTGPDASHTGTGRRR